MYVRRLVTAIALVILANASTPLPAQNARRVQHPPDPAIHVVAPPDAKPVEIAFRLDNEHVIIPVSIQGTAPLPLVLDTGMPGLGVVLYDSLEIDRMGLEYGEARAQVGGAGGNEKPVEARVADGVSLGIGALRIEGTRAIVMPLPEHFFGAHAGIIGAALFENFTVEIDPERSRIRLHRPGSWTPGDGFSAVPIELERRTPYARATAVLRGGREVPVELVVDIGATHPVSLNAGSVEGLDVPDGAMTTGIGRGITGHVTGRVGRIEALRLGDVEVRDVVATFPDREHHSPRGMDSRNGNLGNGILNRFHVVFDYAGGRMWLRPTPRAGAPFEWDMSGLRLDPAGQSGLRVGSVGASSPAAAAGLQPGDLITRVDGEPIAAVDYGRVVARLRRAETSVKLEVVRGPEAPRVVDLALRRLI